MRDEKVIAGDVQSRRPFVDLKLVSNGRQSTIRCQVDTACDDELIFNNYDYATSLGISFNVAPHSLRLDRFLADGTNAKFVLARTTIDWFGDKVVSVLAPDPSVGNPHVVDSERLPRRVLLGVDLLVGCQLEIKFTNEGGTVTIRRNIP